MWIMAFSQKEKACGLCFGAIGTEKINWETKIGITQDA